MPKTIEQWLLFKYFDGELTRLSKPFKTKQEAEKALKIRTDPAQLRGLRK